ncbi:hypothetical protein AAFN60_15985 [Roseibacillus persicicus]|uniref:hypothetical protein n=1 Tax=Roseibacillus persicicus TaxID=454148 RepID=UPI00398B3BEB
MRLRLFGILILLMGLPLLSASETALPLPRGTALVEQWAPDQHLYVKGEVNLSEAELASLEKWLDQNGQNWVILLMESARGERYRSKTGIDAVEQALESDLLGKTGFGSLRDQSTGERNGVFFVIYLAERKFSYFGGDQYEKRGLGGNRWSGRLDAAAISAMRNGGRIADAVRDTVTSIEGRLQSRLQQEKRMAAAAAEEAKVRRQAVEATIARAEQNLKQVERELERFRKESTLQEGDLARKETGIWRAQLQQARTFLTRGNVESARYQALSTEDEMRKFRLLLQDYNEAPREMERLEQKLKELEIHSENDRGLSSREGLFAELKAAEEVHRKGESAYRTLLDRAQEGAERLVRQDSDFRLVRERTLARAAEMKQQREVLTGAAGAGVGGLLLVGGVAGNRRRRKIKERAEALLQKRRDEMGEVSDQLMEMLDWAALVVGPADQLDARGYRGDTLARSQQGLAAVDRAFVISSYVQDLIEQGARLIEPRSPLSGARNLVSRGGYEKAIELLDSEVVCDPSSPPPLPGAPEERLGAAISQDFSLELPQWQERLQAALQEGREALQEVDDAWTSIVSRREKLALEIVRLERLEGTIDDWESDGWLLLDNLFSKWIPVMESELEEGTELADGDPVAALRGPIAVGERMVSEASALIAGVVAFREQCWEQVKRDERDLAHLGRQTAWVEREMDLLSERAEALCFAGMQQSAGDSISSFVESLMAFAERVEQSLAEGRRAEKEIKPALDAAATQVRQARSSLGQRLGVAADRVLSESPERNPDTHLAEGRAQREAALAALDAGEPGAAEAFLDQAAGFLASTRELVTDSEESFRVFEQQHRELKANHEFTANHEREIAALVESLRVDFSSSALLVDLSGGEDASYADAPVVLKRRAQRVAEILEEASACHRSARLLESRHLLREGRAVVASRETLCSEVKERKSALAALSDENELLLEKLLRTCKDLEVPVSDRRVMAATVALFVEAEAQRDQARSAVEATGKDNNPFAAADSLLQLSERLIVVRGEVDNDLVIYDNTVATLRQARSAEEETQRLVHAAQTDGVTDSNRLQKAMGHVEKITSQLAKADAELQGTHGDWRAVNKELAGIREELAEASMVIREELQLAREAMTRISQAEGALRSAVHWKGRYGVRVSGTPGLMAIESANRAIVRGEYHDCIRHAGFAIVEARRAIAAAEAEEARRRRRAQAAAAAQRAAARRSRISSSSSFGRSSSFGSSSRSSSVGRSSFSSSSRVGRSGW